MADKLQQHLVNIEEALGGAGDLPTGNVDKLDWHLTKIEELLEGGTGGGNVDDVKVNGESVLEDKVANINLKTINNSDVNGEGNIEVQEPLVSGTNIKEVNGKSILGEGGITITACQPFNESWPTTGTTEAFCSAIYNDADVTIGSIYYGKVKFSDIPYTTGGTEQRLIVEVTENFGAKYIRLHLSNGHTYCTCSYGKPSSSGAPSGGNIWLFPGFNGAIGLGVSSSASSAGKRCILNSSYSFIAKPGIYKLLDNNYKYVGWVSSYPYQENNRTYLRLFGLDSVTNKMFSGLTTTVSTDFILEYHYLKEVVANPTLDGTEAALTGLEVEGVKYKVDGGNTVHVYHCQGSYSDPSSDFYYFTDNDDIDTVKKLNDDLKRRGYTQNSSYPVISRISIMTPQPNTDFRLLQSIYSTNDSTDLPLGHSTRWTLANGAFSCSSETVYISPVYIRKLI